MTTQHIETLIIGAGQAGLSTGYHLQQLGRPFLIVDGHERIGDNWRHQWDTLKLYSPAKYDGLPGLPFPAPPWSFPGKEQVADYLESYALHSDLPVRMSTRVQRLEPRVGGGFTARLGEDTITSDNVVVATGTFGRTPNVPAFARDLDPSVLQLHSSDYRRPDQLAPGRVLVVGASHSGCDIAYEAAEAHPTVMVGPDRGQIPVPFTSPLMMVVYPMMLFAFTHVLTRSNPLGRKARGEFSHGGPRLRVQERDLAERGVDWARGRVVGVVDGRPVLDDGRVVDPGTVVWCTGFRQVFDWVHLPAFDEDGWPREYRGVVEGVPGLFFCGIQFQYSAASMVIHGVGRDAAHVAGLIARRQPAAAPRVDQAA